MKRLLENGTRISTSLFQSHWIPIFSLNILVFLSWTFFLETLQPVTKSWRRKLRFTEVEKTSTKYWATRLVSRYHYLVPGKETGQARIDSFLQPRVLEYNNSIRFWFGARNNTSDKARQEQCKWQGKTRAKGGQDGGICHAYCERIVKVKKTSRRRGSRIKKVCICIYISDRWRESRTTAPTDVV